MARIIGGIATSHVPAIGAAIAKGLQKDPYWSPFFDGFPPVREWLAQQKPDVAVIFYNDQPVPMPGELPHSADQASKDQLVRWLRLIEPDGEPTGEVGDLTREPLAFPAGRDLRLQTLARGDEGFLLALGYSTQRGYARNHPFVGEVRIGEVELELDVPELPFAVPLGSIRVTECQMVNQFKGSAKAPPQFIRGYGLVFGQSERKAMAMALCDRALRAGELGEDVVAAAQDEEFVISHSDNVQATGFVEHLKLPHYVDFQAELGLVRRMRAEYEARENEDKAAEEKREAAE